MSPIRHTIQNKTLNIEISNPPITKSKISTKTKEKDESPSSHIDQIEIVNIKTSEQKIDTPLTMNVENPVKKHPYSIFNASWFWWGLTGVALGISIIGLIFI
jgi:hypothetical protein